MSILDPRKTLAKRLADIEKKYPEEDLNSGDYGRLNRLQQAEARAEKNRLIAEARQKCQADIQAVAAAQRRKAAEYDIGGGRTKDVDHAAVANVRTLLSSGASPRKLAKSLEGDALKALRWLVETDNLGGNSATEEQAEALGERPEMDPNRRRLLHQIDRRMFPEWAEEAEAEYVNTEVAEALAGGADNTTAIQAAQIAGRRLG